MSNPNRLIDKTHLSLDLAEERGLVHRDYIAHCLRWSHIAKYLQRAGRYSNAVVLDVGCGKEMPLAKMLYVNKFTPKLYVGVDANKLCIPSMLADKKIPLRIWGETDISALTSEDVSHKNVKPNVVVCLEMVEHITPAHCRQVLSHLQTITSDDCHYFCSTPCYNGSAAGNHINEMTQQALGALMLDLGYKIEGVYGTFASISDYQHLLSNVELPGGSTVDMTGVFERLREYYDTNVLSIIFAPLFPAHSRNCLWHLTKAKNVSKQVASRLSMIPGPWSQHPDWKDLDGTPEEVARRGEE
jgi:hypothetical protein